jgi:uncharacterized protein (DUF305 family)
MNFIKTTLIAALASSALTFAAHAQEDRFQLPEQCTAGASMGQMDHSTMDHGAMAESEAMSDMPAMMGMEGIDMESMPEHVRENMERMMTTMPAMHDGMMNEDPDVAFACGMIAHHQGAIDMAEVLLEHGDDDDMRALAEEIIAAQEAEIEQMTTWLAENAN